MATSTINTIVEVESLDTGAMLFRIGKMRVLQLSDYQGANSTLKVDSKDAPNYAVGSSAIVTGPTGLVDRIGRISVSNTSPYYVQRYAAGSYNNATAGMSGVSSTDKTSGVAIWTVA